MKQKHDTDDTGFWLTLVGIFLIPCTIAFALGEKGNRLSVQLEMTRDSLTECRTKLCKKEEDGMAMFVVPCSKKCKEGGFK